MAHLSWFFKRQLQSAMARFLSWAAVLALLAGTAFVLAEETASTKEPVDESDLPLAPEPAAGRREDLPPVFSLEAPAGLDDLKAIERHVKKLAARVSESVVSVVVGDGVGSGVVISEDGLILTVAHVSGEASRNARVIFPDGKSVRARTLGANYGIDSGLMKITEPGKWPYVPTGLLDDARMGDWVLAFGHPGGFDKERSHVVRLGRIILLSPEMVQTDCTLTAGDSGGPLFDMHGRVIGIHSRISESTAGNFHVPISTYHDTWTRLASGENWGSDPPRPRRAYIGARGVDDPRGCRLERVDENGPAHRAGVRVGDVVVKVNDEEVKDAAGFRRLLQSTQPGDEVKLELRRDDVEISVTVTVERWRFRRQP